MTRNYKSTTRNYKSMTRNDKSMTRNDKLTTGNEKSMIGNDKLMTIFTRTQTTSVLFSQNLVNLSIVVPCFIHSFPFSRDELC